jgi:hypothetical protein
MGALLREPGGGSCSRGSEGYERKALGMDRGSVWATCHEPIYWGLKETVGRVAGGGVFLSVGALRREPGGVGLPCRGPLRICRKGSRDGQLLLEGPPPFFYMEEGSSTGHFERWEGSGKSASLLRERCGEGSFWGIRKNLVRSAQGTVMSVSLGIPRNS